LLTFSGGIEQSRVSHPSIDLGKGERDATPDWNAAMFSKILIASRGEIAGRIIRAAGGFG
jgi:hypothetical protein